LSKDATPALRTNRSFVIREGRFTDGQKKAFETLWPKYGIDTGENDLFDPTCSFVNQQPLILDVGFGNGDSLLSLAQQRPDMNFLGVEVYRPGIGAVLLKLQKHDINNVRVMNVDAMQLLKTHMPSDILAGVMVWFPDPWPKKRHHKRRLVQEAFLSELSRCMQNKGILHLASDWQPYVEFMFDHVALVKTFNRLKTDVNPLKLERPPTRFEQRGLRKGHLVSDLIYQVSK